MRTGTDSTAAPVVVTHRSHLVADVLTRALVLSGVAAGSEATDGAVLVSDTGPADLVIGGAGPVTPRHDLADLCDALGHLLAGRTVDIAPLATSTALPRLTDREREILGLLAAGASNSAMAGVLGISPHTVRTHVQNLLAKLGADSRVAAASLARRHGLASAS